LKVALTLADLEEADKIGRIHLAEAISYRTASANLAMADQNLTPGTGASLKKGSSYRQFFDTAQQ
jgi:hypothetical protein